jgi:hypothetical protein
VNLLTVILLVILVLALVGTVPAYNYGPRYGYGFGGLGGLALLVLLILLLTGRLP